MIFKILKAFFFILNIASISILLVIHFVLKEGSYKASLLFYTFPLPVIIFIILVLSVFTIKQLRKYNVILALLLLLIWCSRSFKINISEDLKETDLEVVFWNASRKRNFNDLFNENNAIPDVAVLVEYNQASLTKTKLKYPDYHFYNYPIKEIGIFSKTPISIKKIMPSKYQSTVINFEIKGINFYAVDISGSIDVPRSWELKFVEKAVTKTKKTIVLGDFNVPLESKYLNSFKTNFKHAFVEKGNGFIETWFWNLPLLSLDHIWVSKDLKIIKTKKLGTFKSDHSLVKTYVR